MSTARQGKPGAYILVFTAVAVLTGCPGSTTTPTPVGTPTIAPFAVATTIPNAPVAGTCTTLTGQRFAANVSLSFEPTGIFGTVGVSFTGGTYTFSIQPMVPLACTVAAPVPAAGPVTVTLAVDYFGERTMSNPLCMNASEITVNSFVVSGIGLLDGVIRDMVTDRVHQALDDTVADRLNRTLNGAPAPAGTPSRCANWIDLGA